MEYYAFAGSERERRGSIPLKATNLKQQINMHVLKYPKMRRNDICHCQPTEERTIYNKAGEKITFTAYKSGGKKFKNCHGKPPVSREMITFNDSAEMNRFRRQKLGKLKVA
jgi:hypothetical protein